VLEWQTAGDSKEHWLPLWRGKLLHSRRDPIREAKQWVNKYHAQLEGSHSCFVFGLAGGFHIEEIRNQFPHLSIVVVENNKSFLEVASPLVRSLLPKIDLAIDQSPYELMSDDTIEELLKKTFCIAEYSPSVSLSPDYYRNMRAALCGRDWKSFNFHSKVRGQAWMNHLNFVEKDRGLLSIKDITREIHQQAEINPDMMKWLCLGELVK
jgi:hypothetical protein